MNFIAEAFERRLATRADDAAGRFDDLDAKARAVAHPLTAEQTYMIDYQLYTPLSTMYNLFTLIRVEKGLFESDALAAAVTQALRNHPSLATTFSVNDDSEIVQSHHPELVEEIRVERLSQFDFDQMKDDLVKPYKIIGSRLYRCRLFETEKAQYLFFDVHHTVFDGTSFKVLMGDIAKSVSGEALDRDYYYLTLAQREALENSPRYEEARRYFESAYGGEGWTCALKPDHESRDNRLGELSGSFGISAIEHSAYPYNEKNAAVVADDLACFLYQGDIREGGVASAMFEQVDIRQNQAASQAIMDTEVVDGADGVDYAIHYAASRYEESTVRAFEAIFRKVVRLLASHLEQGAFTFGDIRKRL